MKKVIDEFLAYQEKIGDRKELYQVVAQIFKVKRALYPGSHIDLSPSKVIPTVIYIDSFKGAVKFFKHMDEIRQYLETEKTYKEPVEIDFYGEDYYHDFDLEPVDLIISQYAGFVSQATKRYLKKGGILLSNDSHGDATLAYHDKEFEFLGIINAKNELITDGLDEYFKLDKKTVNLDEVRKSMKLPKYKKRAENYIFKKV
jgi:hypothetical protein